MELTSLGDEDGLNLLFLAAKLRHSEAKYLIDAGLSPSSLVKGFIAADVAYETKNFDFLEDLLKSNSRFPGSFEIKNSPNNIFKLIETSVELRKNVLEENLEELERIIEENRNFKYFFDTKNESAAAFSIVNKKFKSYEFLVKRNIIFGPREDIDQIMNSLNEIEKREVRDIHRKNSKILFEKYLMVLVSNSSVGADELEVLEKIQYVYKAFEFLNDISSIKPILKAVAACKDFEICFDFNRKYIRYLDPSAERYTNGLYYFNGRVLIGALLLLDPEREQEVYGVLAHELCHFAMCLVYDNDGKPYFKKDAAAALEFRSIVEECKVNKDYEPIVGSVFDDYPEEAFHPELIVRPVQLLATYDGNVERMQECYENYTSLCDFYENNTISDIENAIPDIENKANEALKKAKRKISILKNIVIFLAMVLILGGPALFYYVYEPKYSWDDLDAITKGKILNSSVSYYGLDTQLSQLLANDSEALNHLSTEQLVHAMNQNYSLINKAINSILNPYIYLNASNLTENIWNKLLNSKVRFQGYETFIMDMVSNRTALQNISSQQIKTLLSNDSFDIQEKMRFSHTFYIPRKFARNKDFSESPSDGLETLNNEEALNTSESYEFLTSCGVFLLADAPGSGKSAVFQFMVNEIKEVNPNKWVQLVELKYYENVFKNIEEKSLGDATEIARLISSKILSLKGLANDIFIDQFMSDSIVLLWDAVDEISKPYQEVFLKLSQAISNKTENLQYISTRLQFASSLKSAFENELFSLVPYTEMDTSSFILNFLKSNNLSEAKIEEVKMKIETFITSVLGNKDDSLKDEVNNPLLLLMISEIALNEKLSENLENIYSLYDEFITMKLQIILQKNSSNRLEGLIIFKDVTIHEIHEIYALRYILGNFFLDQNTRKHIDLETLEIMKKLKTWTDDQISYFGILSLRSDTVINFVHRTFGEFFVAKYIINNIYNERVSPRLEEMTIRLALLHTLSYEAEIYQVIQKFIYNFLDANRSLNVHFSFSVIEGIEKNFDKVPDYYAFSISNRLFIKFFEKDTRIFKTLSKINAYKRTEDWLSAEHGITLKDKGKTYIENEQFGMILLRCWQFKKLKDENFIKFVRKTTKTDSTGNASRYIIFGNLTMIDNILTFLNFTKPILTEKERKEIFLNVVYAVNGDSKDESVLELFITEVSNSLNSSEIILAFKKQDANKRNIFFKTALINDENLNNKLLTIMEDNFSNDDIYEVIRFQEKAQRTSAAMIVAQFQDIYFLMTFMNFTLNHTTENQFKELLLQRDNENHTMLHYAHNFPYPDNFDYLTMFYYKNFPIRAIQQIFTNLGEYKLPSFVDIVGTSSVQFFERLAIFLSSTFVNNPNDLVSYLSRRNENGDTIFSIYKNEKSYRQKIQYLENVLENKISDEDIKKLYENNKRN